MLRRSLQRWGGDKTSFAAQRRVILPYHADPDTPQFMIKAAFTTDPMKESSKVKYTTGGPMKSEVFQIPKRLEGSRSRAIIEKMGDKEFQGLVEFIQGADFDKMITGRRFKAAYAALTDNDHVFVWLCMVAMAVLNPGDMRSRLLYRHLQALSNAVVNGELDTRTAFRFYESAVRSPAYREIARRQLNSGNASRIAGICAAADVLKDIGATRRPMTSYYQLFQRITERSEALTPWGFPPLYQFEEQLQLEERLRFFGRKDMEQQEKRQETRFLAPRERMYNKRIFFLPPDWRTAPKWTGPWNQQNPGIMPD